MKFEDLPQPRMNDLKDNRALLNLREPFGTLAKLANGAKSADRGSE